MKKIAIKTSAFMLICLIILMGLERYYTRQIPKIYKEKAYWLFEKKNKNYRYAVLGSSRAESSFDCKYFDSLLHTTGINLSINGAGLVENELTLSIFLENNSIDILFLELSESNLSPINHFSDPVHLYTYFPFLDKKKIDSYFQNNSSWHRYLLWKLVPFSKYAEYNTKFSLLDLLQQNDNKQLFDNKGYLPFYGHNKEYTFIDWEGNFTDKRYWTIADYSTPKEEYEVIDPISIAAIERMFQLCKEKNIQVILYTAPSFSSHFKKCKYNALDKYKFIDALAIKHHSNYINYAYWKHNNEDSLYYDYSHPNSKGAQKMTYIMKELYLKNFHSDSIEQLYFQDSITCY